MQPPKIPDNEVSRLAALQDVVILDSPAEKRFDRLTLLAKQIFNTPISLISLVDSNRQWFKSRQGLDALETERDISFCGHAILDEHIFCIPDATKDNRFADNPLVTGPPNIRFYAGAPLHIGEYRVGTLCIIDNQPRELTLNQKDILRNLADCVENELNQIELNQKKEDLRLNQLLGQAIAEAQSEFIAQQYEFSYFYALLKNILPLTNSQYGFIGETYSNEQNETYINLFSISQTNMSEKPPEKIQLTGQNNLLSSVVMSTGPIILNESDKSLVANGLPIEHPPINNFLGIPIFHANEVVAIIGIINRQTLIGESLVNFLHPLIASVSQLVHASKIQKMHLKSEMRLKAIITGTNTGTWEWNVQTGKTLFNQRWAEIIGYTLEELAPLNRQRWIDLTHPEDLKILNQQLEQHFSGETDHYDFQYRMRHKSGHWVWVHDRGQIHSKTSDNKPLLIYGTHTDVTKSKNAQFLLEESRKELQSFFDLSLNFLCIANVNGYFEKVNSTFSKKLGYSNRELLNQPFIHFIHPEDQDATNQEVQKLSYGMPTVSFTNRYRKKNNDYITLMWNCAPDVSTGKLYATAIDITRQKNHEQALRDQAEHTLAILTNMVDGIITIDQDGLIDSANPSIERIFGYSITELHGQNINCLMPSPYKDNHDMYIANYQKKNSSKAIGYNREVEGKHKDGTLFPLEVSISEITRKHKPMYVGLVRDISERKRIEKMKTEFISIVSHELRTPLTSISGALSLINGGRLGELPDPVKSMLDVAQKNSKRLTFLINDLLDMEKLVAGKMSFELKLYDIAPLIKKAIEINQTYTTKHNVEIKLIDEIPDVKIRVDSYRFMQVLSNLFSNAIKYSPKNSSIDLSLKLINKQIKIIVSDYGVGIPSKFHKKIFNKFSQADSSDTRKVGGTGLGLAISREIIERMNGSIGFDSTEGKGATFYFKLPYINSLNNEKNNNLTASENSSTKRLLVIENNFDVAELISQTLTESGFSIDIAYDKVQALLLLKQQIYSAITLGTDLPEVNIAELFREIRNNRETSQVPVLIISTETEANSPLAKEISTKYHWLKKPFKHTALIEAVEKLLIKKDIDAIKVLHIEKDINLHEVIKKMAGCGYQFKQVNTLKQAKKQLNQSRFNLILMDTNLTDCSDNAVISEIKRTNFFSKLIILSSSEPTSKQKENADGYLLKSQISPLELKALLKRFTFTK
ncbi:PAS domain S-box protein [Aliikangiella sp. IMCC44359]|uniref:PAS domain S-box protein n=1 Tax=Aliikangiella sp. IMCC44359 TaxID=3459125 RepID=UPI00403AAE64